MKITLKKWALICNHGVSVWNLFECHTDHVDYGHVRPAACESTLRKLEHDFNSWHSWSPVLQGSAPWIQLGVPPQVALSSLGDFSVQAIVCFPVLVCLSWTRCFHLLETLWLSLVSCSLCLSISGISPSTMVLPLRDHDTRRDTSWRWNHNHWSSDRRA